jgi:hypothetical protein
MPRVPDLKRAAMTRSSSRHRSRAALAWRDMSAAHARQAGTGPEMTGKDGAASASAGSEWRLDRRALGSAARAAAWGGRVDKVGTGVLYGSGGVVGAGRRRGPTDGWTGRRHLPCGMGDKLFLHRSTPFLLF